MTDNDNWTGEVHERRESDGLNKLKDVLKLTVNGVTFAFDSVVIVEDEFRFSMDNRTNVRIHRDDMPDGAEEWLGEYTDGFGNAVAPEQTPENEDPNNPHNIK